jgi:hypothetical protein
VVRHSAQCNPADKDIPVFWLFPSPGRMLVANAKQVGSHKITLSALCAAASFRSCPLVSNTYLISTIIKAPSRRDRKVVEAKN